jgi:hypothetical protein
LQVFDTLFEVVSSFGNVGLTMGEEKPGSVAAFAADLGGWSIFMLCLVQFAGKLRLFPNMTDSALSVIMPIDANEVLSDDWLNKASRVSEDGEYIEDGDEENGEEGEEGEEGGSGEEEEFLDVDVEDGRYFEAEEAAGAREGGLTEPLIVASST